MKLDPEAAIEALRARGAARADPVRFRYLQALARRTAQHEGEARHTLERTLAQALADGNTRHEAACAEADATLAGWLARFSESDFPDTAGALRQARSENDFPVLRRLAALPPTPTGPGVLGRLLRELDHAGAAPAELKTLTQFRRTWARLGVDRQLSRSQAQLPASPGPLNSHLLALRALQLMQASSPAYLERFVSQVETLLWLEAAAFDAAPPQARATGRESQRKRKPGPAKAAPRATVSPALPAVPAPPKP